MEGKRKGGGVTELKGMKERREKRKKSKRKPEQNRIRKGGSS